MNDAMDAAFGFTKLEEGGYTDDPRDSGNWTSGIIGKGVLIGSNMGVGAPCLVAYNARHELGLAITAETMRELKPELYEAIAVNEYWDVMPCDQIPDAIALMVFDYGWNRGCGNSTHELQEALGVTADGHYGPYSRAAMRGVNDLAAFAHTLAEVQREHYQRLDNFTTYGAGWLARTARREMKALEIIANEAAA
jgi:lysozyme family protein